MSSPLPIRSIFIRDKSPSIRDDLYIPPINLQRHFSFNVWIGVIIISGLMTWAICTRSDEMIAYAASLIGGN